MRSSAGVISILLGVGFGAPGIVGAYHFSRTGQVWTFMGLPTYDGGPFERIGLTQSTWLLAGFVLVCAAEIAVGLALLTDLPGSTPLAIALLPLEMAFWIGFALPFGPILGTARTILLLL